MRRLILIMLLFPSVIFAQNVDDLSINLDESLDISISAELPRQVLFTLDDTQYIRLTASSIDETIDPVLWIMDANDRLVAYNDNTDQSTEAQFDELLLQAGDYTIFLDSFNGVSEGTVALMLERIDPNQITITENEQSIVITGHLLEDTHYVHLFEVFAGQILSITAQDQSGNLDPYLLISDDNQQELASNDDHASHNFELNTFDAQIRSYQVLEDGIIHIEIRDFLGRAGAFEIHISIE